MLRQAGRWIRLKGEERSEDAVLSDGEGSRPEHVPEESKPHATRHEDDKKPRRQELKRRFSWLAGDEGAF